MIKSQSIKMKNIQMNFLETKKWAKALSKSKKIFNSLDHHSNKWSTKGSLISNNFPLIGLKKPSPKMEILKVKVNQKKNSNIKRWSMKPMKFQKSGIWMRLRQKDTKAKKEIFLVCKWMKLTRFQYKWETQICSEKEKFLFGKRFLILLTEKKARIVCLIARSQTGVIKAIKSDWLL